MSTLAGLAAGVQAALLLARGQPAGLGLLATEEEPALATAARSFWAALLCLPAFVCLQLIDIAQNAAPPHAFAVEAHGFALHLCGYIIEWAGLAVLTWWLARALGRAVLWPTFIATWNWCNVVQSLLLVTAKLPWLLGMPDMVGETVELVAVGWALWLEWYVARLALGLTAIQAVGLVVLAETLDNLMQLVILSLAGGS